MSTINGNGTSDHLPFDEDLCERYLFGELSEAEQERFETAYFSDDSFFNKFLAVKDEVLDLYSRNELDHDKRHRMEPHFLATTSRKKRLTESRDFVDSITLIADRSAAPAPAPLDDDPTATGFLDALRSILSPLRLAAAGGLIVLIVAGSWIVVRRDASETAVDPLPQQAIPKDAHPDPEKLPETAAINNGPQRTEKNSADPQQQANASADRERAVKVASEPPANDSIILIAPTPSPTAAPPSFQMAKNDPANTQPPEIIPKQVPVPVPTPDAGVPPDPKPELTGARTASVRLDSASRSATKRNTAQIGAATQDVVIRMVFSGEAYSSYSVRISGVGGGVVWRAPNLKTGMNEGTKSLAVKVPASSLTRKDYFVVLEGRAKDGTTETIREYYLRVDRQ